ncbi:hypothetical protein [Alienimonas sp. DA493]|uniref:hypothetical protein n=1 Tax=Alienimonas sp. DA493 TaxID=3373605 RepID=UPI003754D55C
MATKTHLGDLSLAEAAEYAAGNWQRFDSFVWRRADELEDADRWTIHYTHHRDSGLLDQSNAEQIRQTLGPFAEGDDPDVVTETHSHWAVGHIDGFSLRVYRADEITEAFRTFHRLMESLADYPILDEGHYGELESEATFENVEQAAWSIRQDYDVPDDWHETVFGWLRTHRPCSLENVDDQGGWPDDDDLEAAFDALDFAKLTAA